MLWVSDVGVSRCHVCEVLCRLDAFKNFFLSLICVHILYMSSSIKYNQAACKHPNAVNTVLHLSLHNVNLKNLCPACSFTFSPTPFAVSSGSQASLKVSCQVFPDAWTFSGDAGRSTSVQLGENRTGGFTWGPFFLWIQSSDTILLHTR